MNKPVNPITGNSTLMRPRFSPGLLLRDDDLRQGVDYTRDLSRLLFRSLFGCGVVCGLEVTAGPNCGKLIIQVGAGVALDCTGDPIQVPNPQSIQLDPSCGDTLSPEMWVILRHTEKCCAPRSAACSCDDEETTAVCTRERDCYEIRVVAELPACTCPHHPSAARSSTSETAAKPEAFAKKSSSKPQKAGAEALEMRFPSDCWCVDPTLPMYHDHYCGKCGCECVDSEWVVLARINEPKQQNDKGGSSTVSWPVDHSVRRFVRPVLMRDPLVYPCKSE